MNEDFDEKTNQPKKYVFEERTFWQTGWGFLLEGIIFLLALWLLGAFNGSTSTDSNTPTFCEMNTC